MIIPIPALIKPPYMPIKKNTKQLIYRCLPIINSLDDLILFFGLNTIKKPAITIIIANILLNKSALRSIAIWAPIREPIKAEIPR